MVNLSLISSLHPIMRSVLILSYAVAGSIVAAFSVNDGQIGVNSLERCNEAFARVEVETNNRISRRSFINIAAAILAGAIASPSLSCAATKEDSANGKIILNSLQAEIAIENDPLALVDCISNLYKQIESKYTQNGLVDYISIGTDADFPKLEKEMSKLENVSLKSMNTPTKMAFVINLYNTLIRVAFVTAGIPKNDLTRLSFFDKVAVNVGGDIFTFNDLENGILRANSVPPYHLTKPFGKGDLRESFALTQTDPRIHFALNCGAKSCPAVRRYSADRLEEELQAAAIAFCDDDSNVLLDGPKAELRVSKIFKWYNGDFSKGRVPLQILNYLTGEKKATLDELVKSKSVSVDFAAYDWTTNDSRSKTFG